MIWLGSSSGRGEAVAGDVDLAGHPAPCCSWLPVSGQPRFGQWSVNLFVIGRDPSLCYAVFSQDYDAKDLEEFQETILRGCDFNRDGKINKKELTMILMALSKHNEDDTEQQ